MYDVYILPILISKVKILKFDENFYSDLCLLSIQTLSKRVANVTVNECHLLMKLPVHSTIKFILDTR